MKFDQEAEMDVNFFKDIFFKSISSKKIEASVHECMKRCTYKPKDEQAGSRIKTVSETFEPEKARGDYIEACFEVMAENIRPFTKGLYAALKPKFQEIVTSLR